jgi:hypothetical protein
MSLQELLAATLLADLLILYLAMIAAPVQISEAEGRLERGLYWTYRGSRLLIWPLVIGLIALSAAG